MSPLWLRVDAAAADGHGLAVSELSGGRLGAALVSGHESVKSKRPRSQSGDMSRALHKPLRMPGTRLKLAPFGTSEQSPGLRGTSYPGAE